jgi:hypothetical protein
MAGVGSSLYRSFMGAIPGSVRGMSTLASRVGAAIATRRNLRFEQIDSQKAPDWLRAISPDGSIPATPAAFQAAVTNDRLRNYVETLRGRGGTLSANNPYSDGQHVYSFASNPRPLEPTALSLANGMGYNLLRSLMNMFPNAAKEITTRDATRLVQPYDAAARGDQLPTRILAAPSQSRDLFSKNVPMSGYTQLGLNAIIIAMRHRIFTDGSLTFHTFTAGVTPQHPLVGFAQHVVMVDGASGTVRYFVFGAGEHPIRSFDVANNFMQAPLWDANLSLLVSCLANAPEFSTRFGEDFFVRLSEPEVRAAVLEAVRKAEPATVTDYALLRGMDAASGAAICLKSAFLNDVPFPQPEQLEADERALNDAATSDAPILDAREQAQVTNDAQAVAAADRGQPSSPTDPGSGEPVDPTNPHDPSHGPVDPTGPVDPLDPHDPLEPPHGPDDPHDHEPSGGGDHSGPHEPGPGHGPG